jgi:O-antigen ligase
MHTLSPNNDNKAGLTPSLILICGLIVFAPLARGAVHPWATTIIQIGVILAAIFLVIGNFSTKKISLPKTPLNKPIIAIIFLCTVSFALSNHKPFAFEGFVMLLTYITAYYLTQSSIKTRKQQRTLVYVIISTAVLLSVIGILKRYGVNPFLFWEYEELNYSSDWLSSTYGNHNHMAGFLEMAIPFLIVFFLIRQRNIGIKLGLIFLVLFLLVIQAFTQSRGGWVSTIGAMNFMMVVMLTQKRFKNIKLILVLVGATLVLSVFILVSTPIVERVMTLGEQIETESMVGRLKAWTGTIDLIKDHPYIGTGPGTYAIESTKYQSPGLEVMFIQAHNDYLHFIADIGILIIPIMFWILFVFFKTGFKNISSSSRQTMGFTLGVMTSVVGILIHSIIDFNLLIPANAMIFTVIVGIVKGKSYRKIF